MREQKVGEDTVAKEYKDGGCWVRSCVGRVLPRFSGGRIFRIPPTNQSGPTNPAHAQSLLSSSPDPHPRPATGNPPRALCSSRTASIRPLPPGHSIFYPDLTK
ncbi:Hypothetical protein NTJ_03061 [Nesidiocoris tenuis]|uniref:Uncharacterized protein n=1 Tax=Nesidiocoris tenuis TaxID=355587 RepID=A0ABN7AD73_9HEMI|nr:Hypothetical protein NTJ_03061 [Nesidiocoris tenuis]